MIANRGLSLRELNTKNVLLWEDLKRIPWHTVPVRGTDEYERHARQLAARARDFRQFYTREEREYASALDAWLTRYNLEHMHPVLLD